MERNGERRPELSDDQRDLLRSAVRMGYFEVPREAPLSRIAAAHDLSSREASERLRRAVDAAVRDATLDT